MRRSNWPSSLALALTIACGGTAFAEVVKKKQAPPEAGEDAQAPGGRPDDAPPAPDARSPDPRGIDEAFLERLEIRVAEWERAAGRLAVDGLTAECFVAPDGLAYKAARTLLDARAEGLPVGAAVDRVARALPRWKDYRDKSLFVVRLRNHPFRRGGDDVQVLTLTERLERQGILLRDGRKRRIPARLAGLPANLRLAELRIQKFWVAGDGEGDDGATRLRRGIILRGPSRAGMKPKVSKPFQALVLEEDPAEIELLTSRSRVERGGEVFAVELANWKRYVGPFVDDKLDLNDSRTWDPLSGLRFDVRLPPAGTAVAPELTELIRRLETPPESPADAEDPKPGAGPVPEAGTGAEPRGRP